MSSENAIYTFRQRVLDGVSCREIVQDMIADQIENNLESILDDNFGAETFASYAGKQLMVRPLEPRMFRKTTPEEAIQLCIDEGERQAETDILAQIDVCLALGEEESEWNWEALAHFANARWNLGIRDRDLKKIGRDRVDEHLIDKARRSSSQDQNRRRGTDP